MGKKRRIRGETKKPGGISKTPQTVLLCCAGFIVGAVLTTTLFLLLGSGELHPFSGASFPNNSRDKLTLNRLLAMTPHELEKVDIALMNLICAKGLKGAESLDIEKSLSTLDSWAEWIREDTERRRPAFFHNRAKYDNSINLFRAATMALCLKEDLGVHYDQSSVGNRDFSDSKVIFLHGLLGNHDRAGTCTSMPVLCAAIGRRLGYPIKLVLTKGHIFCRWDDGEERFNIEVCCIGVDTPSDKHYRTGKYKITSAEYMRQSYLKSLTSAEELALFLGNRAANLMDTKRLTEAQVALAWQNHLMPNQVPTAMTQLSLADDDLNEIARKEYQATGKAPQYAIDLYHVNPKRTFIWQLPKQKIERAGPILPGMHPVDRLYRQAQQDRQRRAENPLYHDPVAPTIDPKIYGR